MKPIVLILCIALSGCAGLADQINKQGEKATTVLLEAANVVENARCKFRTVEVLAKMITERGAEWAAGYALSCPNLKPIMDAAKRIPTVRVE